MQLEEAVVKYFDTVVKEDNLKINMTSPMQPETLPEIHRRLETKNMG